jgi:hypothetical protein
MNTTTDVNGTTSNSARILHIITAFLGILVYIAGFIGNVLSLLLFRQKELRQVSTGLIFLLLNIFGTIHLLSLIIEFLDRIFQIQVFSSDVMQCQFILWLQNATRTICSFLAATVSIDRFIRSEYPMKSRIWCSTKNVIKLFIIYFLFSILFYAFFFYPSNVFDSNGKCSFPYDAKFRLLVLNIMPPIRFILIGVLPTVVMIGCGGRMLFNIQQAKNRIVPQKPIQSATLATQVPRESQTNEENRRQTANIDHTLFLMVLANVIAYIITQIPFNTYTLYYGYETADDFASYSLIRAFLLMWSSAYFGIGFYLFCIASPQFRKQFITIMKQLCFCYRPLQCRVTT